MPNTVTEINSRVQERGNFYEVVLSSCVIGLQIVTLQNES